MKLAIQILLLFCLLSVASKKSLAYAPKLPADGQVQTFCEIQGLSFDSLAPNATLDLRNASIVAETSRRYANIGDSIATCRKGNTIECFRAKEGNVFMTSQQTRIWLMQWSEGKPYLLKKEKSLFSDSISIDYCAISYPETHASHFYESWQGGNVLIAPNDTIEIDLGVHATSIDSTLVEGEMIVVVTENYRLYADKALFPIVEAERISYDGMVFEKAWVCPPWDQPVADVRRMPASPKDSQFKQIPFLPVMEDEVVAVTLCDVSGKVLQKADNTKDIDTTRLMPGGYIMQIQTKTAISSQKIWIE